MQDIEIEHLLKLANWSQSTMRIVTYENGRLASEKAPEALPGRTSSSCTLEAAQTKTLAELESRLATLAGSQVDHLEPLNLVRYEPGQFFKPHHDGGHRPVTVFLYLNDVPPESSGETDFMRLGLRVRPQKGCAVIWNNLNDDGTRDERLYHQGLPPKDCLK